MQQTVKTRIACAIIYYNIAKKHIAKQHTEEKNGVKNINSAKMKENNIQLVFDAIRENEKISRILPESWG